jgi:hypothetical protein
MARRQDRGPARRCGKCQARQEPRTGYGWWQRCRCAPERAPAHAARPGLALRSTSSGTVHPNCSCRCSPPTSAYPALRRERPAYRLGSSGLLERSGQAGRWELRWRAAHPRRPSRSAASAPPAASQAGLRSAAGRAWQWGAHRQSKEEGSAPAQRATPGPRARKIPSHRDHNSSGKSPSSSSSPPPPLPLPSGRGTEPLRACWRMASSISSARSAFWRMKSLAFSRPWPSLISP